MTQPRLVGADDADWSPERLAQTFSRQHPGARVDRIGAAYRLAESAHRGAQRKSGDPYITHPLTVAGICAELGLDEASVCAALLHDVVEDTDTDLSDIAELFVARTPGGGAADQSCGPDDQSCGPDDLAFGAVVASLVEGLTKLDGIHFDTEDGRRAAELRRLLAHVARDPRVLVVKLADRLHNMRTLDALAPQRRDRIAAETAEVYAPLAHRLGMAALRSELEDLCFATLAPEQYRGVERALEARRRGLAEEMEDMAGHLAVALSAAGVTCRLTWRLKHAYGVFSKMQRTGKAFDEILDVVGLRVVCETEAACYTVLGVTHGLYTPVPGSFTDYIAAPRLNGYQSLHTTVTSPTGRAVEIQVRSEEMHQVAEFGVAAHWAYKESGGDEAAAESLAAETAWMRRLLEAGGAANEYLEQIHGDLARQEIYCFTPKGRIIALPEGATPIDFAYLVHTEVGDHAVGARVNGAHVGLDHRLADGDRVEIVTSSDPTRGPNPDWASWVATARARSLIRRWHTRQRRERSADSGRRRIRASLESRAERTTDTVPTELEAALDAACGRWGLQSGEQLAASVGEGRIHPDAVAARLMPGRRTASLAPDGRARREAKVLVEGLSGVEVRLARCCAPEPFDPLVGWVSRSGGVSVHTTGCSNVAALLSGDTARLVSVGWSGAPQRGLAARVRVGSFDRPGLVAAVAAVLAAAGADIIAVSAESSAGLARQVYEVSVGGETALADLERGLWDIEGVTSVGVLRHGDA